MKLHELKTHPEHYGPVTTGEKKVELRIDDRDFETGDVLVLREYDPEANDYTGNVALRRITHVTRGDTWLQPGVVALSISNALHEDERVIVHEHSHAALRNMLASCAMSGLVANPSIDLTNEDTAKVAMGITAAMLAALDKPDDARLLAVAMRDAIAAIDAGDEQDARGTLSRALDATGRLR